MGTTSKRLRAQPRKDNAAGKSGEVGTAQISKQLKHNITACNRLQRDSEPLGDYGGWDCFGDYLAWFECNVMGFGDTPDLRGASL